MSQSPPKRVAKRKISFPAKRVIVKFHALSSTSLGRKSDGPLCWMSLSTSSSPRNCSVLSSADVVHSVFLFPAVQSASFMLPWPFENPGCLKFPSCCHRQSFQLTNRGRKWTRGNCIALWKSFLHVDAHTETPICFKLFQRGILVQVRRTNSDRCATL